MPTEEQVIEGRSSVRTVVLVWLSWALLLVGYQAYVRARFEPQYPDYALSWTHWLTADGNIFEEDFEGAQFLRSHTGWDSDFYVSIALEGYDDPTMNSIPPTFSWEDPQTAPKGERPEWIATSHAFFPFYGLTMRAFWYPLQVLGLDPVTTATLAGVVVSVLGTLGAMLALYDLARDELGESGGVRAAFYLVIFPAGMFLAQVYTEGLFLGLSFGALALARRRRWVWAALLAVCATWTRAAGAVLLLPMVLFWVRDGGPRRLLVRISWREVGTMLLVLSPLFAYLVWNAALGEQFRIVESRHWGRGLLLVSQSWQGWGEALEALLGGHPHSQAYYLVEFAAIVLGLLACALTLKRRPVLALYSLVTIVFSLTSGVAHGMHRYVMAAPVVFLVPARWGKRATFDRAWTLANVLLMGVFASMFSFDFWAG